MRLRTRLPKVERRLNERLFNIRIAHTLQLELYDFMVYLAEKGSASTFNDLYRLLHAWLPIKLETLLGEDWSGYWWLCLEKG